MRIIRKEPEFILARSNKTTKVALAIGILIMVLWSVLGTGTSLAWFQDESEAVKNVFNFAVFDLDVEYKNDWMTDYDKLELDSNVFGDEALYEPGYTQVVYLRVNNLSTVDMRYKLSVDLRSVRTAKNIYGADIYLPNYLRYGVVFADSETMLERDVARIVADRDMSELKLNSYSEWDNVTMSVDDVRYVAIVVYMPEEVDNIANYRDDHAPSVEMGLTIYAEQPAG